MSQTKERAPSLPFNHLAVLGFDRLKRFVPSELDTKPSDAEPKPAEPRDNREPVKTTESRR